MMGIALCGRVTGKVFTATGNRLPAHCVIECAGVADDLLNRFSITTATQRIVCVVIERNVEHRAQIEVESEESQQSTGDVAVPPNEIDIVLVAQLLGIGRLVADQTQARDATAFLADADNGLDLA